ncbi:MAG: permease-like cell division protein FtsX [Burkholderiales bacterium]
MNWLLSHFDTLRATVARLVQQPFATLLNVIVFGIALALPVGFYLGLDNLQRFSRQITGEPQVSLFLSLDASAEDAAAIEQRLQRHAEVGQYRFVPRQRALENLKRSAGLSDVLGELNGNPLPDAFVVTASSGEPESLERLRGEAAGWPKVEYAQLDSDWARKLDAALRIGRLLVTLLGLLLSVALIAITFNTIRLQILTRSDEIEVSKLIGATNPFIRRPFLYFGTLQGLVGGLAAWLIVTAAVQVLNGGLTELAGLYGTSLRLDGPSWVQTVWLLLLAGALGWLGAWLSVSRHLWQIEPQ